MVKLGHLNFRSPLREWEFPTVRLFNYEDSRIFSSHDFFVKNKCRTKNKELHDKKVGEFTLSLTYINGLFTMFKPCVLKSLYRVEYYEYSILRHIIYKLYYTITIPFYIWCVNINFQKGDKICILYIPKK